MFLTSSASWLDDSDSSKLTLLLGDTNCELVRHPVGADIDRYSYMRYNTHLFLYKFVISRCRLNFVFKSDLCKYSRKANTEEMKRRLLPLCFYFQCTALASHPFLLWKVEHLKEEWQILSSWVSPLVCIHHSISSLIGLDRYLRIRFQPIVPTAFLAGTGAIQKGKLYIIITSGTLFHVNYIMTIFAAGCLSLSTMCVIG